MSRPFDFPPMTIATAPDGARGALAASERQFGFIASPVARVARAPSTLKHLLAGFVAFEHTSLSLVEREVIAMTVAWENECHYCMALHSALLADREELAPLVAALRTGTPISDTRLQALRQFVQSVLRDRGRVGAREQAGLRAAGFDETNVLEIVLGVGVYVLSTLLNIVTDAEVDPPFLPFEWRRPSESGVAAD